MTNREAVISEIHVSFASDNAIDKAIIDQGITGSSEYDGSYKKEVAIAALSVLKALLSTKSVQEGGYTLTLQVEKRIFDLQTEYGLLPVVILPIILKPKVRGISVW